MEGAMKTEPIDLKGIFERHRREGFGWRYGEMDHWPADRIFEQLRDLGIDTDAERFHAQAAAAGGIEVLDDQWNGQLNEKGQSRFWPDFPMIAIRLLWKNLAPDVLCAELFEERLYEVIDAEENHHELPDRDGLPAALAVLMDLVRYLEGFEDVDERRQRFSRVHKGAYWDYPGWIVENAERWAASHPDAAMRMCDVLAPLMPEERSLHTDIAFGLARAGRRDEAIRRAEAILHDFPHDRLVMIGVGDVYEKLGDGDRAIQFWTSALARAVADADDNAWDAAMDRLGDLLEKQGRGGEINQLKQKYPEPPRPPRTATSTSSTFNDDDSSEFDSQPATIDRMPSIVQPIHCGTKVGRNDPCPCGSGKKYKKCCMP
jgi:hypothetical protein